MSVIRDPELESLLAGLHARSDEQAAAMRSFDARRTGQAPPPAVKEARAFLSDKLVALDRDNVGIDSAIDDSGYRQFSRAPQSCDLGSIIVRGKQPPQA